MKKILEILKITKDFLATLLGLITSLCTALVVIDFKTFDFKNPNDLIKLFVIAMPAIGGYMSEVKTKEKNG